MNYSLVKVAVSLHVFHFILLTYHNDQIYLYLNTANVPIIVYILYW